MFDFDQNSLDLIECMWSWVLTTLNLGLYLSLDIQYFYLVSFGHSKFGCTLIIQKKKKKK
jgi:hypothetical protein